MPATHQAAGGDFLTLPGTREVFGRNSFQELRKKAESFKKILH